MFETRVNTNDHYLHNMEGEIIELKTEIRSIKGLIVERYRQAFPEDAQSIDDVEYSEERIDVLCNGSIYSYNIDDLKYRTYIGDDGHWIMEKANGNNFISSVTSRIKRY